MVPIDNLNQRYRDAVGADAANPGAMFSALNIQSNMGNATLDVRGIVENIGKVSQENIYM